MPITGEGNSFFDAQDDNSEYAEALIYQGMNSKSCIGTDAFHRQAQMATDIDEGAGSDVDWMDAMWS